MTKSHAMARYQGYIISVKKRRKTKPKEKKIDVKILCKAVTELSRKNHA